jgi:hypothetical protein
MNLYKMKKIFHPDYKYLQPKFDFLLENFKTSGELIGSEKRNVIKVFGIEGFSVNIKSFKKPNILNSFIYNYIRKSKAQRSFEYAKILLSKNIGTPQPFAFYENKTITGLKESFYFSLQQDVDLMFRNLVFEENYPNRDEIIKQSALFFFNIHNQGIEFIDNTAGNTLIKKVDENVYEFYLVDLNRMSFHDSLSLEQRVRNIAKLTTDSYINKKFSEAYAPLFGVSEIVFYDLLMKESQRFLDKFNRRKKLKKRLKFWKK